jgi:hypothetical protein
MIAAPIYFEEHHPASDLFVYFGKEAWTHDIFEHVTDVVC